MGETVRRVEYYYALVSDKPGEGRRLLEYLSEKSVNLIAFTAFPLGYGKAQFDFVTEDSDKLKLAADDAGIKLIGPKKAFVIQGENRIGALIEHHLNLSNAGISVYAANGITSGDGRFGYIFWVDPKDYDRAAEVLGM